MKGCLGAFFLLYGLWFPGLSVGISGWWDASLALSLEDRAFSLQTSISVEFDLSETLTGYAQCRWAEGNLDTLTLKYSLYYSRKWRFKGTLRFKKGSFYKGEIRGRYHSGPWEFELKGSLEAGEKPLLEGDLSYETENLSHEIEFSLWGEETFMGKVTWTYLFPLPKGWRGKTRLQWEDRQIALFWEGKGDSPWGKLDLQGESLNLQECALRREIQGDPPREISLSLDFTKEVADITETFYWRREPDEGYGLRLRSSLGPLKLERFEPFLFGSTWKISADILGRALSFSGAFPLDETYTLFADLSLDTEGLDGDMWMEISAGDFLVDIYLEFSEWRLTDIETEVYLEF